jgi:hypothetical protein
MTTDILLYYHLVDESCVNCTSVILEPVQKLPAHNLYTAQGRHLSFQSHYSNSCINSHFTHM